MNSFRNKKGITPIISVILLLMMTIAIAGLAYTWLQRMQGSVQTSSENATTQFTVGSKVKLSIDGYNLSCNAAGTDSTKTTAMPTFFVRNAGTEPAHNLQLFIDNSLQAGHTNASLNPGTTTGFSLTPTNCSNWVNRSRVVKIVYDEGVVESEIYMICKNTTYSAPAC